MGKSEPSCTFCMFFNLWFGPGGKYYYAHERCIKDQEGAKSVKQRYIIVLLIYTSDCTAVLTGLCNINAFQFLLMQCFFLKKGCNKEGKMANISTDDKKILLVIHKAVVV